MTERKGIQNQGDETTRIRGIRHLLSHLHGELTVLEATRRRVLLALRQCSIPPTETEKEWVQRSVKLQEGWNSLLDECARAGWVDASALRREASAMKLEDDAFFRLQRLLAEFERVPQGRLRLKP